MQRVIESLQDDAAKPGAELLILPQAKRNCLDSHLRRLGPRANSTARRSAKSSATQHVQCGILYEGGKTRWRGYSARQGPNTELIDVIPQAAAA